MCPECGSDNVRIAHYDFGRCQETGYRDAGDRYECIECGYYGEPSELVTHFRYRAVHRNVVGGASISSQHLREHHTT